MTKKFKLNYTELIGDIERESEMIIETNDIKFTLDENKISSSGFHIRAGLQLKLLMLDSFLYYRHIFADNIIPGAENFGSLNLRLGLGF